MRMSTPSNDSIAVLVSVRIDPVSGRATRSRADAAGVALASQALGAGRAPLLCTAGPMPDGVARDYLAQGVGELVRLSTNDDSLAGIAAALAEHCRPHGLVITGARAESGPASGLLPHVIAQHLQRPLISDVMDLQPEADGAWRIVQALSRGARRVWRLERGATAVLVTSARLGQRGDLPLRHAWVAAQQGRIRDQEGPRPMQPVDVECTAWQFEPSRRQRRPLTPPSTESGAARMARATGTSAPTGQAGQVLREGAVSDKARVLLAHLRGLALVPSAD
jgi:electron transfer flavoprotein beta subunit